MTDSTPPPPWYTIREGLYTYSVGEPSIFLLGTEIIVPKGLEEQLSFFKPGDSVPVEWYKADGLKSASFRCRAASFVRGGVRHLLPLAPAEDGSDSEHVGADGRWNFFLYFVPVEPGGHIQFDFAQRVHIHGQWLSEWKPDQFSTAS
jgi:hypothetical protein